MELVGEKGTPTPSRLDAPARCPLREELPKKEESFESPFGFVVRTDHADIALTGAPASESEREPALATEHLLLRIIAAARRSTRRISATSASKCFILVRC